MNNRSGKVKVSKADRFAKQIQGNLNRISQLEEKSKDQGGLNSFRTIENQKLMVRID